MNKHYVNGQELNSKILKGIDVLADNVGSTLGPRGKNVILLHRKEGLPVVTKDGVTVAKFVDLEDPIENVGAQIVNRLLNSLLLKLAMVRRHPLFWRELL